MDNNLKVYVTTSNKYLHVLKVFSYLFNRYWSPDQEVVVIGFDKSPDFELPKNFKFVSLGVSEGWGRYTLDIQKMLNEIIEDDYFIWLEENEFIIRPVNFEILEDLKKFLAPNLARIDFTRGTSDRPHNIIKYTPSYQIIEAKQKAELRVCMRAGIFNKRTLLNYCKGVVSSSHIESVASDISKNDGSRVFSSNGDWVVKNMDGICHLVGLHVSDLAALGKSGPFRRDSSWGLPIEADALKEMTELGYIKLRDDGLYDII